MYNSLLLCEFQLERENFSKDDFFQFFFQGFWYFAEKKAKFCWIFRGKFAEKSADFAGFSQEKSQNSRNNRPIFAGEKSKFAEKSAHFAGF